MNKPSPNKVPATHVDHHWTMRIRRGRFDLKFIDHVIIFTGPLVPLAILFQGWEVWSVRDVSGFSLTTWVLLLISSMTMATYAIYHRVKPLIITYIPLVIANLVVIAAIIKFS